MNAETQSEDAVRMRFLVIIVIGLFASMAQCTGVFAQSSSTPWEFWPAVDGHIQLRSNLRVLVFGEYKNEEGAAYQQFDIGTGLGYQFKRIAKQHLVNIDPDKEHYLVFGGGYEHLTTIQSGESKDEDRIAVQAIPRYRPPGGFLLEDRNRVEFRWVNGTYSTRYRNKLTIQRDFQLHRFRLTPYVSAEAFHDGASHSWNEEQYTVGIELPYKRLLMLETYYLRQNCDTCSDRSLDVLGATLNFYFRNKL